MIEVMKANHQEVEVVDMCGIEKEVREARIKAAEESAIAEGLGAEEVEKRKAAASVAPSKHELDMEMERKFVAGTTKGISSKVKAKKMSKRA